MTRIYFFARLISIALGIYAFLLVLDMIEFTTNRMSNCNFESIIFERFLGIGIIASALFLAFLSYKFIFEPDQYILKIIPNPDEDTNISKESSVLFLRILFFLCGTLLIFGQIGFILGSILFIILETPEIINSLIYDHSFPDYFLKFESYIYLLTDLIRTAISIYLLTGASRLIKVLSRQLNGLNLQNNLIKIEENQNV